MASLDEQESVRPTGTEVAGDLSKSSEEPSNNEGGSIDEKPKDSGDTTADDDKPKPEDVKDVPAPIDDSDDDFPEKPEGEPRSRPTGPVAGAKGGASGKPRPTRP